MRRFQSRVVDATNALISAAQVTIYKAGTADLASLFSGEALVALANPLKSDHLGVFEFYAESRDYDLDVKDPVTGFSRRFFDVSVIDARDIAVLKSGDTMVGDLAIRKSFPALRLIGLETAAKDWRVLESAGNVRVQENTGTEGSPTWTERFFLASNGLAEVLTNVTTLPRGLISAQHNDGAQGAQIIGRKSRGTHAAPTAVLSGDRLQDNGALGYDGTVYGDGPFIRFQAAENWTPTAHGTDLRFLVNALGGTGSAEALVLSSERQVIQMLAGSAAVPGLVLGNDANTGFFLVAADAIGIATGGVERLRIEDNGRVAYVSTGDAGSPTIRLLTDPNTGIFWAGADDLAVAAGGVEKFRLGAVARFPNEYSVEARNAAGTANIQMIKIDSIDRLWLGNSPAAADIIWGKPLVALGGGAAPTLGTIGGAGPATAAQHSWLRVVNSDGGTSWIPQWR